MLQQSVSEAVCLHLGADPRLDVVIHLDVAHAVVADHPVHHLRHMLHDLRVPEIELITTAVVHPLSVPEEEPVVRHAFRKIAVNPHHLKLQPDARHHAVSADRVRHLADSARKAFPALLPFSDSVPPGSVRVPAGVDHKVLAARLRGRLDQRELLLRRRIAEQAVHIVIEDHRQLLVVPVRTADPAAIARQFIHCLRKIRPGYADRRRHRCEGIPRPELL